MFSKIQNSGVNVCEDARIICLLDMSVINSHLYPNVLTLVHIENLFFNVTSDAQNVAIKIVNACNLSADF